MTNLCRNWKIAASDLGLTVIMPFILTVREDVQLHAEFLVKSFGAKNGMIVFTNYNMVEPYRRDVVNLEYGFSVLDEPLDKEEYSRKDYISLLCDWGWSADPNAKPKWMEEDEAE